MGKHSLSFSMGITPVNDVFDTKQPVEEEGRKYTRGKR